MIVFYVQDSITSYLLQTSDWILEKVWIKTLKVSHFINGFPPFLICMDVIDNGKDYLWALFGLAYLSPITIWGHVINWSRHNTAVISWLLQTLVYLACIFAFSLLWHRRLKYFIRRLIKKDRLGSPESKVVKVFSNSMQFWLSFSLSVSSRLTAFIRIKATKQWLLF